MERKKSAKDIAFDRERAKFRKEIRKLEAEKRILKSRIDVLECTIDQKEDQIRNLEDWNARLLGYMDLSKEDVKAQFKREKKREEIIDRLDILMSSLDGVRSII